MTGVMVFDTQWHFVRAVRKSRDRQQLIDSNKLLVYLR